MTTTPIVKKSVPKQIAGKGANANTVAFTTPPESKPLPSIPQKQYGIRMRVFWREELMKRKVEVVKIMAETNYSVDLIDSEGFMHKNVQKDKLVPISILDTDGNEVSLAEIEPSKGDLAAQIAEKGVRFKVLWKDKWLEPFVEVITVLAETSYSCEIINSENEIQKNVHKSDMIILGLFDGEKA